MVLSPSMCWGHCLVSRYNGGYEEVLFSENVLLCFVRWSLSRTCESKPRSRRLLCLEVMGKWVGVLISEDFSKEISLGSLETCPVWNQWTKKRRECEWSCNWLAISSQFFFCETEGWWWGRKARTYLPALERSYLESWTYRDQLSPFRHTLCSLSFTGHSMMDTLAVALRVAEEAIEEAISKAEACGDSLVWHPLSSQGPNYQVWAQQAQRSCRAVSASTAAVVWMPWKGNTDTQSLPSTLNPPILSSAGQAKWGQLPEGPQRGAYWGTGHNNPAEGRWAQGSRWLWFTSLARKQDLWRVL